MFSLGVSRNRTANCKTYTTKIDPQQKSAVRFLKIEKTAFCGVVLVFIEKQHRNNCTASLHHIQIFFLFF